MGLLEIFLVGIGLSMDAFAVSICKGLAAVKASWKNALTAGIYFGGFQALMPLLGYFLGTLFQKQVAAADHWIAFILLGWIGVNMIREANEQEEVTPDFSAKAMLPLAVATSIDAFAAGVTFSLKETNIWIAITMIGITTFCFSAVGVKGGAKLGEKFQKGAQIAGGVCLILIGTRILLTDLGIL